MNDLLLAPANSTLFGIGALIIAGSLLTAAWLCVVAAWLDAVKR